ncbi:flippase [Halobacterium zhouii]|uniref:flippase n=1 Tax=Halobacterium zhouii TaxID=2902624 RepID=UPI001E4ED4F3|nr:flippase [Halobacterium zhouii]
MSAGADENISALLSSATLVLLGGLVYSGSTLVERVVIGRLLTPEAFGEASIGIAIVRLGATLAMLGFGQGIARYITRFDDSADRRGVWVSAVAVVGVATIAVTALLYANAAEIAALLFESPDSPRVVQTFVLALPFLVGMRLGLGGIRGMEHTVYRTIARDLLFPLGRIALIVALVAVGYDLVAVGYAYLVAAAASCVVAHYLLHRLLPLVGQFQTHARELLRFSAPLVVASILGQLLTRTDTIMLGALTSSHEVAMFNAARPLAGGILMVLSSFGFLYLPMMSRLDAGSEREQMDRIYQTTTKWIYVVTFPAFLTFVMFPADVLRVFFGPAYTGGAPALVILSIGFFANAILGRNRETLSALGLTTYLLVSNTLAFTVNVAANLLLIPHYGLVGAAVASAASFLVMNAVVSGILLVGYDISPFSSWSVRAYVVLPLTLFPPAYALSKFITLTAVTLVPFLVAAGAATVAVVSLAGCLQSEDWIALEFVEDQIGLQVPYVRRYLPQR